MVLHTLGSAHHPDVGAPTGATGPCVVIAFNESILARVLASCGRISS
jgi:hypothetical protein